MPTENCVIWQDFKPVLFNLVFLQTSLILSLRILGLPCGRPQIFGGKFNCMLIFYDPHSRENSQSIVVTFTIILLS
jgi:hypothetical protein